MATVKPGGGLNFSNFHIFSEDDVKICVCRHILINVQHYGILL